ncbi:hypothetical protein K469DRAFT_689896 [Zopfia rhizophila CBS 207.26]|uniref:Uncharacterized protein n=1 Tax=Zopfia rhizophila CBS 207.26 TaxID=1314779 RepID=A0A6A6DZE4_9PEZI|nr:hypothetical protein K469DRAFT_689896 [Zopfia rhizophila CBS 207.26]
MAPLDPNATARSNTIPLLTFSGQVLAIAGLTTHVLLTIRRAARALPPSTSTRAQNPVRRRHVAVFAILSLLSLASVTTFSVAWRVLSYFEWAEKGNHETPGSLWSGWYGTGDEGVGRWRLGDWTRDIDLVQEADAVAISTPEGFLWASQYVIGLVASAIFIGVEGHKRNLPTSTIVAFVLLSEIGSLGYTLNLFLITILYTPLALHRPSSPRRDALFTPKPAVYLVPILGSLFLLAYIPTLLEKRDGDIAVFRIGFAALPFFLAFAPQIIPSTWAHQHVSKSTAHRSFVNTFYVLGMASTLLHYKQFLTSFWINTPLEQASVYDLLKNAIGKQNHTNRLLTGLGNTAQKLKLVSRHPAISVAGSDVLFTTISLCAWAFVRNLNVEDMLENSFLSFFTESPKEKHVVFEDEVETKTPPAESPPTVSPVRKRGRPRKNGTTAPSTPSATAPLPGSLRRSTRRRNKVDMDSDREDSFEPPAQAAKEVTQTESDGSSTQEDVVGGGESAALALFLSFVGGIGQLTASVLGAEVTRSSSGED